MSKIMKVKRCDPVYCLYHRRKFGPSCFHPHWFSKGRGAKNLTDWPKNNHIPEFCPLEDDDTEGEP